MNNQDVLIARQAGQRLMIGFDGLQLNDDLKFYIEKIKVGGLILFARNIASRDQVRHLCRAAQEYAASCGQPSLFIGIDQEGGVVSRLKPPFTQFSGNPHMKTIEDAEAFARTTAAELGQIGVNMNMAPVLDVALPQGPSIMRARAFGHDPLWVARMGTTVIDHLQANGVMAVGKHFPGIGRTVLDSHEDLPELDITPADLAASDLVPFQAAIDAQVAGIMLSHIRYLQLDAKWPASLSVAIARDLLRKDMQFNGLVLTDDIDMGAVAKHYNLPTIITRCLAAQNDIVLICHPGPKIKAAFDLIRHHLSASEDAMHSGVASMERIMAKKQTIADC